MNIIKIIVDKKVSYCCACPISTLHICGKETVEHPQAGSAVKVWAPDMRCLIRLEGK